MQTTGPTKPPCETTAQPTDNIDVSEKINQAREILRLKYGYSEFRLKQEDIISTLLKGEDALALLPTGGGKSLCYQIPSLVRQGTGVVISPLIALMQDQVDALRQLGIRAAYLNSSQDGATQRQIETQLLRQELDLLYIAPERLLTERLLQQLEQTHIALFAIDEAHCVSQWGHDFRKEYQQLSVLHQRFPHTPRIALTATADERTRREIVAQLNLSNARIFINSFDRPNIHYRINDGNNAREQLWRFINREHPNDAGIVYCLSRRKVESVAEWFNKKGRTALAYHAGLPDAVRQQNQERFLRENGLIIVATIAFGMGIDKPDVRFVAHLNLPKSIEAYYQETGRAGRDQKPANAWMSFGLQDVMTLRHWVEQADADERYKRVSLQKLEAMLGLCEMSSCRRQALLKYFGESLEQRCGNCDNCVSPPEQWDGTVVAQKILSCIVRTGQRFGVGYIIDVLLGNNNERIQRNGHDRISTFGIGTELSGAEWRSVLRQLAAQSYISTDLEGHGSLLLNEKCRPLLRGETRIQFRKTSEKIHAPEKPKQQNINTWDEELLAALKTLRQQLAAEQNVPAYIIFHDQTLIDVAALRPANLTELSRINGIGQQKLDRYGEAVLQQVATHPLPNVLKNNFSNTINETLYLYSRDMDVDAIAQHRDLKPATILGHFAEAIEAGMLQLDDVLQLDEDTVTEILLTAESLQLAADDSLKSLFHAFNGEHDYGVLKCVVAGQLRSR
ncbi:MAG: DNA helicase RecQ [Gammaproteobacteria bacterium]|nr:DNA helicase RecQ [Gammaproteobacteria bacterium]MDH5802532.1 DNA helicase RecQ [Gammaproteobacteria bacterium]